MQSLFSWELTRGPLSDLLEFDWEDAAGQDQDTLAFARLMVAGAIENIKDVDKAISANLQNWELTRIAKVDLAILRLGAYSLLYQSDVPASVTIDEAIDIAKEFGSDDSYRFVNGVLDGIRKNQNP